LHTFFVESSTYDDHKIDNKKPPSMNEVNIITGDVVDDSGRTMEDPHGGLLLLLSSLTVVIATLFLGHECRLLVSHHHHDYAFTTIPCSKRLLEWLVCAPWPPWNTTSSR
jgi:hypothetical protein